MRSISGLKADRVKAATLYDSKVATIATDIVTIEKLLHDALFSAIVICYAQGLAMLQKASTELDMQIPLQDAVKVWRQGCIIRSEMLELFYKVCNGNSSISNILLDDELLF